MQEVRCCFFFFQAEDGIRDVAVTGVQTCALPISRPPERPSEPSQSAAGLAQSIVSGPSADPLRNWATNALSEENIRSASPASTIRPLHKSAIYSPIWRAEAMLCVTTT